MATLAQEVKDLKARLAHLAAMVQRLIPDLPLTEATGTRAPLDQTQLVAWLKRHGLARDPTAEERRVTAQWGRCESTTSRRTSLLAAARCPVDTGCC